MLDEADKEVGSKADIRASNSIWKIIELSPLRILFFLWQLVCLFRFHAFVCLLTGVLKCRVVYGFFLLSLSNRVELIFSFSAVIYSCFLIFPCIHLYGIIDYSKL